MSSCRRSTRFCAHGEKEEGATSTPFDMVMMNDPDGFHFIADVIDRVPAPGSSGSWTRRAYELYEQQGRREGRADQDWFQAEREIRNNKE